MTDGQFDSNAESSDDALEMNVGRHRERIMYGGQGEVRDRPRYRAASLPPDPDNPAEDTPAVQSGHASPFAQNRSEAAKRNRPRIVDPLAQAELFFDTLREFRESPQVQRYIRTFAYTAADAARQVAERLEETADDAEYERQDLAGRLRARIRRAQAAARAATETSVDDAATVRRTTVRKIDIDDADNE